MSLFTSEASEEGIYTLFRASEVNMGTYIWALAPIKLIFDFLILMYFYRPYVRLPISSPHGQSLKHNFCLVLSCTS